MITVTFNGFLPYLELPVVIVLLVALYQKLGSCRMITCSNVLFPFLLVTILKAANGFSLGAA